MKLDKDVKKALLIVISSIFVSIAILAIIFIEIECFGFSLKTNIFLSVLGYLLICLGGLLLMCLPELVTKKKK